MEATIKHAFELVAAHVVAELIIGASAVVLGIWIWKPVKRYLKARAWLSRAVQVGVRNFFPSRESYSVDRHLAFTDYLSSAKNNLSYFGHWLAFSIEQHDTLNTLCQRAAAGVKIQLVLLDPDMPADVLATYSRYLGQTSEELHTQISETWLRVREAKATLSLGANGNLELRRHKEFIPYSAFWFDHDHDGEHILIDMKLFGAPRRDAYGIEFHQTPKVSSRYPSLFQRYATSLDRLRGASQIDVVGAK